MDELKTKKLPNKWMVTKLWENRQSNGKRCNCETTKNMVKINGWWCNGKTKKIKKKLRMMQLQRQRKWQIWLIDSELRSKVEQEENALRLLNNWRCFTIWKYTVEKSQTNAANVTIVCKLFWNHKCDHDVTMMWLYFRLNRRKTLWDCWPTQCCRTQGRGDHQKSLEILRNYHQEKF